MKIELSVAVEMKGPHKQLTQQPLPLFGIETPALCWMNLMGLCVAKLSVSRALGRDIGLISTLVTASVIVKKEVGI